jgi:plasmid stabilization system protein ParE
MRVVVSEQADADLLQIFQYLAQRNPGATEAVLPTLIGNSKT